MRDGCQSDHVSCAKPVYVDIEPITYNLNIDLLEQAITPKTKVILVNIPMAIRLKWIGRLR